MRKNSIKRWKMSPDEKEAYRKSVANYFTMLNNIKNEKINNSTANNSRINDSKG